MTYTVEDQVAIIYAGSKNLLRNVPVNKVKEFEKDFLEFLNNKQSNSRCFESRKVNRRNYGCNPNCSKRNFSKIYLI
jgi:F0F1-type ATP synthase alpha subunit